MSKLNDLTAAERGHAELVQYLEQLYATQEQDLEDLDAIHTQLHQEFTLPADLSEISANPISTALRKKEKLRQGIYAFPLPRKIRWARQLSLLAAVLIVTLVTGTFVSLLYFSRHNTTTIGSKRLSTPTSVPFPPDARFPMSAAMINANTGWLQEENGIVKHTTDGGKTWQNVTPPANLLKASAGSLVAMSASSAWIIMNLKGLVSIFFTIDAGQHWQKLSPKLGNSSNITLENFSFFNPLEGWATTPRSNSKTPSLISTHDGGKTWSVTGSLPSASIAGIDGGFLNFTSATSGWYMVNVIGGDSNVQQTAKAYHTHDGGRTWQLVTLPTSSVSQRPIFSPPYFFNASDGVLVKTFTQNVTEKSNGASITIYVTHDGGTSWVATQTVSGEMWSIQDVNHWWALDGNGMTTSGPYPITVYSTNDAGQHWLTSSPSQFSILALVPCRTNQCGSDATIWAVGYVNSSKQSHLYKTVDGGKTWSQID